MHSSQTSLENEAEKEQFPSASDVSAVVTATGPIETTPAQGDITTAKDQDEPQWLSGLKLATAISPLLLVFFLQLLDTTIISTAIPKITNHFNSLNDIGWYTASYQLASAALQPLAGKLYVNFSNKWTYITFFAIFEFGSLLCAVAVSSNMLIVGRAIAGAGTAGLQNGAFSIIAACVPIHKRPVLIGICQGIGQLGFVFGPLIGGAFTQYTTWRWCFYINLPLGGVAAILLVLSNIPDAHKKPKPMEVVRDLPRKLDLVGFAIFAPAITMLLLAMQWGGNEYAWDSATVIGLFCGFAGNLLIWMAWNWYKKDDALIPVSMVRKTTVWSSCLLVGLLMSAMYIATYYLPIYFQSVDGATPTRSGVDLLPNILASLFVAIAAGKAVSVVGYCIPFSVTSSIIMAVGTGLCGTLGPKSSKGEWIGYQILFGAGRGIGMMMPLVAVQNSLAPNVTPLAISLCMFTGVLFGALFLSASATIFTNSLRTTIPKYSPQANTAAIIEAGATGFRQIVPAGELAGLLIAYSKSVDRVFFLAAALSAICLPVSFGLGWTNIKKKPQDKSKSSDEEAGGENASDAAVGEGKQSRVA